MVYATNVIPDAGVTLPDGMLVDGLNSTCGGISQTTRAYVYCDVDNSSTINTGDTYTLVSTYTLTVYPAAAGFIVNAVAGSCGVAAKAELICDGNVIGTETGTTPTCAAPSQPFSGTWTAAEIATAIGGGATAACYSDIVYGPIAATCDVPAATAGDNDPTCGGTLSLTSDPAGATAYSWTGPNSFTSSDQNPTISNVDATHAGNYTVVVTSADNCASTATTTVATITYIPAPILSLTDPRNCANGLDLDNDGTKEYAQELITIQPGTPPYSVTVISGLFSSTGVALTPATATALITGPVGGNYTITAYVPANGSSTYSLTVQDSAAPTPLTDSINGGPCVACPVGCAASKTMQWIH